MQPKSMGLQDNLTITVMMMTEVTIQ